MKKLNYHIFVCENEREVSHPRGSCARSGSIGLVSLFKKELLERKLTLDVRAQRAGCLDVCENGPSVVIYPEGIWYGRVQPSDVKEIVESHLVNGKIVERLLIPGK